MTTYLIMQNRLSNEVYDQADVTAIGGGLTQDQIKAAILRSVKHYERDPFWFNEKIITFSTVADQEYYGTSDHVDIPTLIFIQAMTVQVNNVKLPIYAMPFESIDAAQTGHSKSFPEYFAYHAKQLRMIPIPTMVRTITMAYVYRLAELSADGDDNAWTNDAGELIYARAAADIRINVLKQKPARDERMVLAMAGLPFFSVMEQPEYQALKRETRLRRSIQFLIVDQALVSEGNYNINYQ